MKILDRPARSYDWAIYLIIGFVGLFFAGETDNWIIKILCGGGGFVVAVFGFIDLFKEGEKR